ncbi:MAG: hypothetical protein V7726_03910 [Pseudoalteromonas distincta]|uniref:hypothetical protein n=1 Tax=Pseudoalteromonas distincta TaxID=77608 RepID=UPI00300197DC
MTVTSWLTVAIGFVALVATIATPLIAYFNRSINQTNEKLSDHKTHVAETYATKSDVKELGDRMERQMEKGFESIEKLLTKGAK